MGEAPWFEPTIRGLVGGRRVILAGGVPQAWTDTVAVLRRFGATDLLVVGAEGSGVGPAPDCEVVAPEAPSGLSMLERIRFGAAVLRDPPPDVHDAIERFDPDRTAVVLGTFLNEGADLVGRPFVNQRRPEWVALEDKTVVDGLWDACGVTRAPSDVVALDDAPEAAARLDAGDGTVWSADASRGWHGGAAFTRWVVTRDEQAAALGELRAWCDRVRVMPFLEGIPCSIHGVVFPDGIAVLRPVEMVTLRRGRALFYAGCATYWDPPGVVREAMRAIARTVGAHLAATVGYRGAFTVDGVVTAEGFRPTELNPRAGAGLSVIGRSLPDDVPFLLLLDLVAAGLDIGRDAATFEAEVLAAADAVRGGGTWRFGDLQPEPFDGPLWYASGQWTASEPADPGAPEAHVLAAPGTARCRFDPGTWPVGPSVAPAAVAFYAWCDAERGAGIGALDPALDVSAPTDA